MFHFSSLKKNSIGNCAKKKSTLGQAAVEYILVVVVTASIFATLFYAIRRNLFELWVCYLGPKIQSPGGCGVSINDCWDALGGGPGVDAQRNICSK